MKFKLITVVSFVLVLIASAVIHMPISWVYKQLPPVRGLTLDGLDGTLWQGRSRQVVWQGQSLGQLQWQLNPSRLLSGKLEYRIQAGRGSALGFDARGMVGVDFSGLYAQNVMGSVPAARVMDFAPMPLPVDLMGSFDVTVRDYRYAAPYCEQLDGMVNWQAAMIGSPFGELDPGEALAELSCDSGAVIAKADQSSSVVESDWLVNLQPNHSYQLQGGFTPGSDFPSVLKGQLSYVGRPDNNGRYPIRFSGRL